jgi:ABC-type nitrate/sulfonate/bicarbonate transport system substrate-binding protein
MRLLLSVLMIALSLTGAIAETAKSKMTITAGVDPSHATFYVAKLGGFFDKYGLDVQLKTGSSGSAMVPYLIKNQTQAALGAEQAGILSTQAQQLLRYYGVIGKNMNDLDGLKGKKVGVTLGTGGDVFWRALVTKLNLNPKDYTIVPIDAPEMVAALERGNLDAIVVWEPWLSRILKALPNTKLLRDNEGIINARNYVYVNREWATGNPDAAVAFMRALSDASDLIRNDPDEAAKLTATFLQMDQAFTKDLIGKVNFELGLSQASIDHLVEMEQQLKEAGKMTKPIDWQRFIYADILRKVAPDKVDFKLPH